MLNDFLFMTDLNYMCLSLINSLILMTLITVQKSFSYQLLSHDVLGSTIKTCHFEIVGCKCEWLKFHIILPMNGWNVDFTREMTHFPNTLRFWVEKWRLPLLRSWSIRPLGAPDSFGLPNRDMTGRPCKTFKLLKLLCFNFNQTNKINTL